MNWEELLTDIRQGPAATGRSPLRSVWEQDFDRIIFSHPFRRLQDKTQVHPLPEHDFVHTRLTHSLEVSSVGRTLGRQVGEVVLDRHPSLSSHVTAFDFGAIAASASLAHDIGNPPFGHTGESALSEFFLSDAFGQSLRNQLTDWQWSDLTRFEGNAQGFRLLTRGRYGLRLTCATIGAFMKYPCSSHPVDEQEATKRKSRRKYGYFETEQGDFLEVVSALGLTSNGPGAYLRHPLAFLVEAADDICYSVIDLEDGCRLGLVSLEETIELLSPILGDRLNREKLMRESSLNEQLGILRAMAIGVLADACAVVFVDHEREIISGSCDNALIDSGPFRTEMKAISRLSQTRIYQARHVTEIEAAGFEILPGLLGIFIRAVEAHVAGDRSKHVDVHFRLLPAEARHDILDAGVDLYARLRAVIDFVSGLTDRHALSLYRKIKGISL